MPYPRPAVVIAVSASLQDVVETNKIRLDIGIRIFDATAHPGLGGKIDDNGRAIVLE